MFNNIVTHFKFYAGQIAFSPEYVASNKYLQSKTLTVSPNPNNGNFECTFENDAARTMVLKVTNLSGKVIYTQNVQANVGLNTIPVSLPNSTNRPAVLLVSLGYDDVQYSQVKISIK